MGLIENNIDKLKRNISLLIEKNKALEKENAKLESQCRSKEQEAEKAEAKVRELEAQLTATLLSKGLMEVSGGVKNTKGRLNALIRDIDRCISILNR